MFEESLTRLFSAPGAGSALDLTWPSVVLLTRPSTKRLPVGVTVNVDSCAVFVNSDRILCLILFAHLDRHSGGLVYHKFTYSYSTATGSTPVLVYSHTG